MIKDTRITHRLYVFRVIIVGGIHHFKNALVWMVLISLKSMCRSPDLAKDDKLTSVNVPEKDICGRHFLFDKKCKNCRKGV